MSGNDDVPELSVGFSVGSEHELYAGTLEFQTHIDGKPDANDGGDHGEEEVHGADIAMIGREEPASDSFWGVVSMVAIGMRVFGGCHVWLSLGL